MLTIAKPDKLPFVPWFKLMNLRSFYHLIAWLTVFAPTLLAQPNSPDGLTYKTGYSAMMKLGRSLYEGLDQKDKAVISSQPISMDVDLTPFTRMMYYPADPNEPNSVPLRGVWISAGFIDLVNHVAHAKAIDKIEKGYFQKYIAQLMNESGEKELRPLPNDANPKFWTDDMLNEQQSNFNSIVGIVVGIKMAHHTLGHFDKYKDKLIEKEGAKPVPIEELITEKEWEDAYKEGLFISLNAGCFTEGVIPFYEAFDKMPTRPPWSIYFLPATAKFAKMKKDFIKFQDDYLAGRLKRQQTRK
jgi:hypothetical protein